MFLQTAFFWFLLWITLKNSDDRTKAWDLFAIASPFLYALLRLGCFANGCCYGKLCPYPWAVVFREEHALTPLIGLPLHPTQLYAVLHGLILGGILGVLYNKYQKENTLRLKGQFYWLFLILLGSGRLVTESFRAGLSSSLWKGWPVNQWLSCLIIVLGVIVFLINRIKLRRSIFQLVSVSLVFMGCGEMPQPPGPAIVAQSSILGPGVYVHTMVKELVPPGVPKRNLLFVAVDERLEDMEMFYPVLSEAFHSDDPPRLEDLLWWHYAPQFARLYQKVVRIKYESFEWKSFFQSLEYLEKEQTSFDVVLLVHGIPNHLVSSRMRHLISWKDLEVFSKDSQLQFLNLVYLQSCFGKTLEKELLNMGAKSVISFDGFHDNIIFFDIFLKQYFKQNAKASNAFDVTQLKFRKKITHSYEYRYLLNDVMKLSLNQYFDQVKMPTIAYPQGRASDTRFTIQRSEFFEMQDQRR